MKTVAIYPYGSNTNEYLNTMMDIIEDEYEVIPYKSIKSGAAKIEDADIFYLNWLESVMDELDRTVLSEAKKKGVKIVWIFHNRVPHDGKSIKEGMEKTKFLIELADLIITHSRHSDVILKEYYDQIDLSKVVYVPHVNYCGMYDFYGGNVKNRYSIDPDDFVIGFFGAVKPYKNIELLIDSFNCENIAKIENLKLVIAGRSSSPGYKKELVDRIGTNRNIVFIDRFICDSALGSFLDSVDILALPYDLTSSMNSGSMIMAFSYSKSVIIPDIVMTEDFPEELIYKYHYNDDDDHISKLISLILRAYHEGKNDSLNKGENLFEIVRRENSRQIVQEKLLRVLAELDKDIPDRFPPKKGNTNLRYLYDVSFEWLKLVKEGGNITEFFIENGFRSVGIYGMGRIGKLVAEELLGNGISVKFGIDRNAGMIATDITMLFPGQAISGVDVVVVTVHDYKQVEKVLRTDDGVKVVWLHDVIQCVSLMME